MKTKRIFALALSAFAILTSCGNIVSSESSAPDGTSNSTDVTSETTSETVTSEPASSSTPSSSASSAPGTSLAPAFDRSKSLVRPLEDAMEGAPDFEEKQTGLPSGVVQSTTYLNQINDVFWPIGFDALNTWETEETEVQKLLVVPVSFTDKRRVANETIREDISKTFFGAASDTGWESVASYYYKSSRGQFKLTGEVTQWIDLGIRSSAITRSDQIEEKVIKKIYNTLPADLLREYDLNNDGWLDALWIVYGTDINSSGNSPYWAFVSWVFDDFNMNKPYPGVFGWASYEFMYEGGMAGLPQFQGDAAGKYKVDAHTFIHETGHMVGLTDYYDYDNASNPSGGIDMMGNNIIDHNAYSKFLLNWNLPIVPNGITEETSITLRPATTSGDFILLNPEWNGSVFDEYILIEYYTPDVNNYQDSRVAYKTEYSSATGHNQAGVRIWHVDSRLFASPIVNDWFAPDYEVNPDPVTGDVYADVPVNRRPENDENNPLFVYFGASNTSSESKDPSWDLLKLLDASGSGSYYNNYRASSSNSSLFKTGAEITDWNTYLKNGTGKFNDGSDIGFTVRIGEMTDGGVEIILNKVI